MIDEKTFRELAMSFNNVIEKPHFKSPSFRINDKIFASLELDKSLACVKLSSENQVLLSAFDKVIYPVNNHWGKSGWTYIEIQNIREELLIEILESAYNEVLKSKK